MSCDGFDPLIAALGTSALSAEDEARVREHLAECARCEELARLLDSKGLDASVDGEASGAGAYREGAVIAGRYRLHRFLGSGGMGVVWSATQIVTGQPVALKLLRADGEGDRSRKRLLREARAASAVHHPNVVRILDLVEDEGGAPALVMELLVGQTLQRRFDAGPMPLPELCYVLGRVVDALEAAHAAGVVHRDLKPENVFLGRASGGGLDVKLLDFGIARRAPTVSGFGPETLTRTGALVGTPFFMSPEQALGEADVDARTDLWSLGVLLYQGASGVLPTRRENLGQVIKAIAFETIAPLGTALPDLPADIASLAARLLSKERAKRPSLEEARAIFAKHEGPLGDTLDGSAPTGRLDAGARLRSRRRGRIALVALVALAGAGAIGVTVRLRAPKPAAVAARPSAVPSSSADFVESCVTYYDDWFAKGPACQACVMSRLNTCTPLQVQSSGLCTPVTLTGCEWQCGGSSDVNNAPNCECLRKCLKTCADVTAAYYACEIATCAGC